MLEHLRSLDKGGGKASRVCVFEKTALASTQGSGEVKVGRQHFTPVCCRGPQSQPLPPPGLTNQTNFFSFFLRF